MKKLVPERQEMVLDAMDLSLERGSFPCLRSFIEDYREAFRSNSSRTVRDRFEALERAAAKGESYEEIHGQYSLLKLDHPLNRTMAAQGIVEAPVRQLTGSSSNLQATIA